MRLVKRIGRAGCQRDERLFNAVEVILAADNSDNIGRSAGNRVIGSATHSRMIGTVVIQNRRTGRGWINRAITIRACGGRDGGCGGSGGWAY